MKKYLFVIKDAFVGDIYSDTYESLSDGGPRCYNELTDFFRISISIISAIYHLILISYTLSKIKGKKNSKIFGREPNYFEKIIGYFSLIVLGAQFFYRINEKRAIFLFNPCHICLVIQSILLITKTSKNNEILYNIVIRWLFGAWSGLIFPDVNGLDQYFETEMFYIEHYIVAIIQPLTIFLFNRYGTVENINWHYHLIGSSAFVLYQRIILFPLSMLTWANLNFTLCHSEGDPFYPLCGKWYYLFSELYLGILGAMVFASLLFSIGFIFHKIFYLLSRFQVKKEKNI